MASTARSWTLISWLWLALCFAASAVPTARADEATAARAREQFSLGLSAYDRGVYFEALRHFQDAYQLQPHPLVRVNIANCFDKLDRPAEALLNFELFVESGAGSEAQRQEVRAAIAQLKKRVGRLVLTISPDGAKVVVDDRIERRAPVYDALVLKTGRHQVSISLEGYETALRVVDVSAEATAELALSLTPITAPTPGVAAAAIAAPAIAPPPPPAAEPVLPAPQTLPPEPSPTVPARTSAPQADPIFEPNPPVDSGGGVPVTVWVTGGITFATLMSAIITGQLALAADREFDGDLAAVRNPDLTDAQRAGAWEQGVEDADRANAYAVATDVLLSVSIAGAVLTTIFYLDRDTTPDAPVVSAGAGPNAAHVQLQARF